MRKISSGLFVSLDGVVEAPDQWQFDLFDADMGRAMGEYIGRIDTVLMGRKTYQEWAEYWPSASDEPYASFINQAPKYVVSNTLDSVDWGRFEKPRLIRGDVTGEIKRLKQQGPADQPGKGIGIQGSPTLVASLLRDGLLDELTLMVHPVVVGRGKRLFQEGYPLQRLKLVDTMTTGSGVQFLTYHPVQA